MLGKNYSRKFETFSYFSLKIGLNDTSRKLFLDDCRNNLQIIDVFSAFFSFSPFKVATALEFIQVAVQQHMDSILFMSSHTNGGTAPV